MTKENYTQLVELYKDYSELEILGFPCNQFGYQEPGTNEEILKYARDTYGVEFPMFEKCEVNGEGAHEVYRFLRRNSSLYDH